MIRRLCALSLILLCNIACVRGQQISQLPGAGGTIRVNVDRINVGVTVTDSHGHSVQGLRREDFRVFDNGVEQPITGFVPSEEPAQLVLLVEGSTADYLLAKLGKSPFAGADNLLNNIAAIDRVAIVMYSNGPQVLLDFTPDKLRARAVLEEINAEFLGLRANTGSGWSNLSLSVAATLDWLAAIPGSKTILLVSTGIDTSPPGSWQVVREKLEKSDVRILALSVFGDFRTPSKHRKLSPDDKADRALVKEGITEFDQFLRELSEASGGHTYSPKNAKDFDRAYSEIAQLVRGEYTVEFVPPAFDGQLHTIKVKLKRHSYHTDCRPAYLAPPRA